MTHPPLTKTAIEATTTALGLRRLRRRARWWTTAMALVAVAGVVMGLVLLPNDWAWPTMAMALIYGPIAIWVAAMGVYHAWQAGRTLRTYPWQAIPCEHVVHNENSYRFRLKVDLQGEELILQPVPYSYKLEERSATHPTIIWYAGPPTGKGVASPVGGHFPVRVVPVTGPHGQPVPSRAHRTR